MPRAARINWDRAFEIFEAPINPDNVGRFPVIGPHEVVQG